MQCDERNRHRAGWSAEPADLVARYFKDVSRYPVLTRKAEAALMAELDGVQGTRRFPDACERVRRRLVESSLRLVVVIAKAYRNRGMALLDLIQEGNIGVMKAADRFDPERGVRFGTYAAWWIRQGIVRALIDTSSTIRVSGHRADQVRQARQTRERLQGALGRQPTSSEVADALGVSPSVLERIDATVSQVWSIDQIGEDDEPTTFVADIEDRSAPSPEARLIADGIHRDTLEALRSVTRREAEILALRYGLGGARGLTLAEIGRKLSLTREGVRGIQARALSKLRRSAQADRLASWCRPGRSSGLTASRRGASEYSWA